MTTEQIDSPKLILLREILKSGEFHHSTYRDIGTLWEGLRVYVREKNGFNGFTGMSPRAVFFGKDDPDLKTATALVCCRGISVGAFGQG
jgi:hypothetical protein